MDDEWVDSFAKFWNDAFPDDKNSGVSFSQVKATAGRAIVEQYDPPPLPSIVQVDLMEISSVNISMWCSLKLRSVRFLPAYVRNVIRVLSLSGTLTLDGVQLALEPRKLPPHRGSLNDFARGLASEYAVTLLKHAAAVLGKSSVLNVPRVPIKAGTTGVAYLADSVSLLAGEGSSLLAQLAFDEKYAEQQRQIRNDKKISNFGDGVVEAGKSLAQGLEGFMDFVRRPVEGMRRDGARGAISGFGVGMVSSVVKPMSKLGQAISDVGSGLAASVTPDTQALQRRRGRQRQRQPRLLFTELAVIRPWSAFEADLMLQCGRQLTRGMEDYVLLAEKGSKATVLMLFRTRIVLREIKLHTRPTTDGREQVQTRREKNSQSASSRSSSSSSSGSVTLEVCADTEQLRPDIFEAIDDAALKIFSHALKPVNTLLYGMQDLEGVFSGKVALKDGTADPRRSWEFDFVNLGEVAWGEDLQLKLSAEGEVYILTLDPAYIQAPARDALFQGFQSALLHPDSVATWDELRAALQSERRAAALLDNVRSCRPIATGRGGRHVQEVFELERRLLGSQEWRTPWLPTDQESRWRWVDATGVRHPHLSQLLTRDEVVVMNEPPCELSELFETTSGWEIDRRGEDHGVLATDEFGWRYAIAWNSSTWDRTPGIFNAVRKRRWTRTYA